MNTRAFSAYNLARGTLLNSKLTLADNGNHPLKLLDIVVSGMGMDPTAGLWLSPLHATPAVPRVFPFDLIYLDKEYRVLDTAEMGPGIEFPAFHPEIFSALVLPADILHRSGTEPGDRLIVCASSDLEAMLAASALPSPDAVEMLLHHSAKAGSSTELNAGEPGTIELTPERSSSPAAPATAFDQSVLSAVAKVAVTRNTEPKPVATSREVSAPGPSMDVSEAILDPSHTIQPAVVEHRIDPEDLFLNWVVTAPPLSTAPRTAPPEPPAPTNPAVATQETASDPPRQNGRKSKPQPETRAASTDAAVLKPKAKPAPAVPERSASLAKAKPNAPIGANDAVTPGTPASPTPLATTFTSSSYGMWNTSMPTAVAPMSGAKSPAPLKGPTEASSSTRSGASSSQAAAMAPTKGSEPSVERESENPPIPPVPRSQPKVEPVTATEQIANPPKPAFRDVSNSEPRRPGDFVASLQEKLQRVQQSKPSAPSEKAAEPKVSPQPPGHVSAAPSPSAEAASMAQKTSTAPPLKSQPVAQHPPAPSKLQPETASGGLRSKFRQWLHPTSSPSDRRRAARRYVPGMVAHYFTGGAPKPKNVADISMSGMYLLTDDRWMPGTMIQMTLQKPCASGEKKQSINILSRIVRRGSDGVAIEFIMPEALPHISHDIQPSQATDKFALARFL